jgi:hypothetical protein
LLDHSFARRRPSLIPLIAGRRGLSIAISEACLLVLEFVAGAAEGECAMFDDAYEEEGRREEREEGGECCDGVVAVPSRLLMLCKLFTSCSSVVRERELEEKRDRRLVPLFSLQLA